MEGAAAAVRSGYWKLYIDHVLQADQGADLDFLVGRRGAFVPRPDEPKLTAAHSAPHSADNH